MKTSEHLTWLLKFLILQSVCKFYLFFFDVDKNLFKYIFFCLNFFKSFHSLGTSKFEPIYKENARIFYRFCLLLQFFFFILFSGMEKHFSLFSEFQRHSRKHKFIYLAVIKEEYDEFIINRNPLFQHLRFCELQAIRKSRCFVFTCFKWIHKVSKEV